MGQRNSKTWFHDHDHHYTWTSLSPSVQYQSTVLHPLRYDKSFPMYSIYCCNNDEKSALQQALPLVDGKPPEIYEFGGGLLHEPLGWCTQFTDKENNKVHLFLFRAEKEGDETIVTRKEDTVLFFGIPFHRGVVLLYEKLKKLEPHLFQYNQMKRNEKILIIGFGLGATLGTMLSLDLSIQVSTNQLVSYLYSPWTCLEGFHQMITTYLMEDDASFHPYRTHVPRGINYVKGGGYAIQHYYRYFESR